MLGLLVILIIGVSIWGLAGADTTPALSLSGFTSGTRVMAGTGFDVYFTINPAALLTAGQGTATENHMTYDLIVFGGSDAAIAAAKNAGGFAFNPAITQSDIVCRQGNDLINYDRSFELQHITQPVSTAITDGVTVKIPQEGPAHIYASLMVYDSNLRTLSQRDLCVDHTKSVTRAAAKNFTVEKSWGCSDGACIIDVTPQELAPDKTGPVQYKVFLSGIADPNSSFALLSGRYEKPINSAASDEPVALCKTLLDHPTGSGAYPSQSSPLTLTPAGSTYISPAYSISFNQDAPSRRLVAFLMKWDKSATPSNKCDKVVSFAGWSYASSGPGAGTGGTTTTPPATTSGSIDPSAVSGGYFGAEALSDAGSTGTPGNFLTGICNASSNITLKLSNSQGSVNLDKAGLMGLCTPNVGGQVLKLMILLAGFFFTVAVIMSGIAMFRATDSSALEQAKKNLIASAIGAFLVTFANWIVPAFISLINNLFR